MTASIEPWVRDILRCPVGVHPLLDDVDDTGRPVLICDRHCGQEGQRRQYRFEGGIPVLLADEAELISGE